jgi:glycogen debranching enzyme
MSARCKFLRSKESWLHKRRGSYGRTTWGAGPVPLSLLRIGETERAERLRRTALEQLMAGGFAEYYEPFTGDPIGSLAQSWTAAVALDWMAGGLQGEREIVQNLTANKSNI